ncbi:MAG: hypothetical protein NVSMB6_22340 [Burkholderiaceae bacterium]
MLSLLAASGDVMKSLTRTDVEIFLRSNGASRKQIMDVIHGFNCDKPLYAQPFECGEELFQCIRNPSAGHLSPDTGNWFAPSGATTHNLAIIGGGSGRRLHKFRVVMGFNAIEGTASRQNIN